ncbi:MAG TPA: hypothetical protein VGF17_29685 [Phytomonospora sp.]
MEQQDKGGSMAEELRLLIRDAEAALMAHAPDPFSGRCPTCRVAGPCTEYQPAASRLGELRDQRDHHV